MAARKPAALGDKQAAFVAEYLIDLNATQAAIRAGYSAKAAKVTGHRLLTNANVAAAIQKQMDERSKRTGITADRVLEELAKVGFANAADYFEWGPGGITVRDQGDLTPEQTAVVAEVSQTITKEGGTIRVKLHDKLGALEKIGRHLKMFTDRHEHTGADGTPLTVQVLRFGDILEEKEAAIDAHTAELDGKLNGANGGRSAGSNEG